MVDLATSLAAGVLATFVPLFIGLILPAGISKLRIPNIKIWLVAIAAGIIFWFFIDVMGDAVQLDINQGFGNGLGGYPHLVLALMFAVGVGLLFGLERRFSFKSASPGSANLQSPTAGRLMSAGVTFAIAAVVALGIGFHALGEGVIIGASLPSAADILGAIGGLLPGFAYVLHKLLEGFVIGVFTVVASATSPRKIGVLAALSGIPTVIGFFIGIPAALDSSYFFALGGAGAVYVELKLVPIIYGSGRLYASVAPFLLGFYSMYFAGLFHS